MGAKQIKVMYRGPDCSKFAKESSNWSREYNQSINKQIVAPKQTDNNDIYM